MALLSDLVAACAESKIDSQSTLTLFARRLREAGRIQTKGRGRGAAHMGFNDAAALLIACAATDRPEQAVDAENLYGCLVLYEAKNPEPLLDFHLGDSFGDCTAKLLALISEGDFPASSQPGITGPSGIKISRGILHATIDFGASEYCFSSKSYYKLVKSSTDGEDISFADMVDSMSRGAERFKTAKNLTAKIYHSTLLQAAETIADRGVSK